MSKENCRRKSEGNLWDYYLKQFISEEISTFYTTLPTTFIQFKILFVPNYAYDCDRMIYFCDGFEIRIEKSDYLSNIFSMLS